MVTPAMMVALLPIAARLFTRVGTTDQSASVCNVPSSVNSLRILVVGKHHSMADKDFVVNGDAFTKKRV